jgi:hypothetical protein
MPKFFPLIALLFITGCQYSATKSARPDWINNPDEGAVGSSVTHVKGRHYQEELAISRARERLAARYGVEISSIQTIREKVANDRAYVTSVKEIQQAIKKQTVKAHIREIWYDASHDEIWVWAYPIN